MKVVLFCGGLGTRIREYSEAIPKPLIPIGNRPILMHVMDYYSRFQCTDFVLCTGYKANVVRALFTSDETSQSMRALLGDARPTAIEQGKDWRVALEDTGIWRNVGERLWAVREHVRDEPIFCANYSDGLSDVDLDDMVAKFKASGKVACFLAVRPPLSYHFADIDETGAIRDFVPAAEAKLWINGGFFLFTPKIFDYMREGEELVAEPFKRLIAEDQLMAYRYEGFFRAMDTLRDRQVLEDLIAKGMTPWRAPRVEAHEQDHARA